MTRKSLTRGWRLSAALLVLTLTAACGTPDTGSSATQPTAEATAVASATEAPTVESTPSPISTSAPTAPANPLTDGSWKLVRYGPPAEPREPIAETVNLSFEADGNLGGSGGCNSFFGSYEITGTAMTIGEVGSTEMACEPQALMAQEVEYLGALDRVTEFVQPGNTLTLRYPEGELVFDHVSAPPAPTLENTAWRFNGFAQNDAVSMIAGAEAITAEVRDGTISGNGGCNRYNGPVTIQGQQMTIGPIVSTKMACDAMEAETQYLTALQSVTAWEIDDQTLALHHPGGSLLFVADTQ